MKQFGPRQFGQRQFALKHYRDSASSPAAPGSGGGSDANWRRSDTKPRLRRRNQDDDDFLIFLIR